MLRSTNQEFWSQIFSDEDSTHEKMWVKCSDSKNAQFLPSTKNTREVNAYFEAIGKMFLLCLLNGGALPNNIHSVLFLYRYGPFVYDRNVMREINRTVAIMMAHVIRSGEMEQQVDLGSIPCWSWYVNERQLQV